MKISNKYLHLAIMVVVAAIMACGLSITAFASDSDPYMTYLNASDLRTSYNVSDITPSTTLTLRATTANSSWGATVFTTAGAADDVTWTSSNTNLVELSSHGHEDAPNGGYYSNATFEVKGNNGTGSCTIEARRGTNAYVNFTVVIENSYYSDLADNVQVQIVDVSETNPRFKVIKTLDTVTLPTSGDTLYPYTDRAQTFSTPAYALANLVSSTATYDPTKSYAEYIRSFTLGPWGIYVNKITTDYKDANNNIIEGYLEASGYSGWNYRVKRNGVVLPDSKVIGAADFKLQDGDIVYWLFGTEAQADEYLE